MQAKNATGTALVTESAAHGLLRRGPARALAADEERALRMRLGASLPLSSRLERIATATDAEIEVLAYEIEAWMHLRARTAPRPAAAPTASRTKEKIVRALRRKS